MPCQGGKGTGKPRLIRLDELSAQQMTIARRLFEWLAGCFPDAYQPAWLQMRKKRPAKAEKAPAEEGCITTRPGEQFTVTDLKYIDIHG